MKNLILIILSRLVQGLGIGLGTLSILWAGWFLIYSENIYRYLWAASMLIVLAIGILIFKFAKDKIHDDTP